MVTAEITNKSIILPPINNKNKLSYRNITNNNQNDNDFDFENNPSPPIRRYPVRTRNCPTFYHELIG